MLPRLHKLALPELRREETSSSPICRSTTIPSVFTSTGNDRSIGDGVISVFSAAAEVPVFALGLRALPTSLGDEDEGEDGFDLFDRRRLLEFDVDTDDEEFPLDRLEEGFILTSESHISIFADD